MSEETFNWCMIHWKGQWRVYRDASAFPWGLLVTCANTREKAVCNLQRYLGDDCPSYIMVYEKPVKSEDCQDAYEEFLFGRKTLIDKIKSWFGRI